MKKIFFIILFFLGVNIANASDNNVVITQVTGDYILENVSGENLPIVCDGTVEDCQTTAENICSHSIFGSKLLIDYKLNGSYTGATLYFSATGGHNFKKKDPTPSNFLTYETVVCGILSDNGMDTIILSEEDMKDIWTLEIVVFIFIIVLKFFYFFRKLNV